jgi:hypothetical protein
MLEIEHQCLLEFFGEGHRFDDLKRWYTTEEIKNILKNREQNTFKKNINITLFLLES